MKTEHLFAVISCLAVANIGEANAQNLPGMNSAVINCEAYKNYDVVISYWTSTISTDTDYESEQSEESRLIFDYENERLVYAKTVSYSVTLPSEGKGEPEKSSGSQTDWYMFDDGDTRSMNSGKAKLSFKEFIRKKRIPLLEYAAISFYPCTITVKSEDENQRLIGMFESFASPKSILSPDGTRRESWVNSDIFASRVFAPEYLLPVRLTLSNIIGGVAEDKPIITQENVLENVGGVCRLVSNRNSASKNLQLDSLQTVKTVTTGTLSLKWLQFNEDELKFPKEKNMLNDEKKLRAFLKPEE